VSPPDGDSNDGSRSTAGKPFLPELAESGGDSLPVASHGVLQSAEALRFL
jgi:hypothetical protein